MKKTLFSCLFLLLSFSSFSQCWQQVAAGYFHSLGIQVDGSLWAWGSNTYGQLGDGTNTDRNTPTRIGTDTDWAFVTGGGYFTVAIKTDGTLWTWGRNNYGQLGVDSLINSNVPLQVGTDTDWVTASAGYEYVIAKKSNNQLWSWGNDGVGQLGIVFANNKIPYFITEADWRMVATGHQCTLALKNNGEMWGWGSGENGCLADGNPNGGESTPVLTQNNLNFRKISIGQSTTIGLKYDGTLWGWGANQEGGVGIGTIAPPGYILNITQIGNSNDWVDMSMGRYHGRAIKTDGSLWIWGYNHAGQLGDGTIVRKSSPVQVGIGNLWLDTSGGEQHTLALTQNRSLWAWGGNTAGQLGDASNTAKLTPVAIGVPCNLTVQELDKIKLSVFPNPTSQWLNLQINTLESSISQLIITNSMGQQVYTEAIELQYGQNNKSIEIISLAKGIYILTLKSPTKSYYTKWIKN